MKKRAIIMMRWDNDKDATAYLVNIEKITPSGVFGNFTLVSSQSSGTLPGLFPWNSMMSMTFVSDH